MRLGRKDCSLYSPVITVLMRKQCGRVWFALVYMRRKTVWTFWQLILISIRTIPMTHRTKCGINKGMGNTISISDWRYAKDGARIQGTMYAGYLLVWCHAKTCLSRSVDDNWQDESKVTKEELKEAIEDLIAGKPITREQFPSIGCSIKWRNRQKKLKDTFQYFSVPLLELERFYCTILDTYKSNRSFVGQHWQR